MKMKAVAAALVADDYAGQKYSDVTSALADSNLTGVIATRSGDLLDDDCKVTSSEKAPWIKGDDFAPVTDTVLLNLDCNSGGRRRRRRETRRPARQLGPLLRRRRKKPNRSSSRPRRTRPRPSTSVVSH